MTAAVVALACISIVCLLWVLHEMHHRYKAEAAVWEVEEELRQAKLKEAWVQDVLDKMNRDKKREETVTRKDLLVGISADVSQVRLVLELKSHTDAVLMQPHYARLVATALVRNADLCETLTPVILGDGDKASLEITGEDVSKWADAFPKARMM